jgi:hypothetical protein
MGGNGPVFYANPAATGVIPSGLAHTWGTTPTSPAYYFDAAGNLQTAPNNLVRNSTMQGAGVGVSPTYWTSPAFNGTGMVASIAGTGTENGIPYVDIAFTGTSTSSGFGQIDLESTGAITAVSGQTWARSFYIRLMSGTFPAPAWVGAAVIMYNSVSSYIGQPDFSIGFQPTGAALNLQRGFSINTITQSGLASIVPAIFIENIPSGATSFTLRIGAPQVEQVTAAQTAPNPFMPTSGSAYYSPVVNDHNPSTLAALGLRSEPQQTNLFLNNLAPVTQTITVASGTVYTVSFYGTGSIVLSGAAAQTMTGSAGVRTQYTFTAGSTSLTATVSGLSATSYAQVEANAYATSPILTYGTAVTIPSDIWAFTGAANTALTLSKGCIVVEFTPEYVPNTNPRIIGAASSAGLIQASFYGLVSTYNTTSELDTGVTMVAGVKVRGGYEWNGATRSIVANGNAPASDTTGTSITPGMQIYFGQDSTGPKTGMWGSQIMIRQNCTAAQVQRYSTAGANLQAENDNDWPVFAANDNLLLIVKLASGEWR